MDSKRNVLTLVLLFGLVWAAPREVRAHCDTMDGPVVKSAKAALAKGDVALALRWVHKEDEREIREVFRKVEVARSQGRAAKEIADRLFFETLVRVHRAGEGAPYTGLKPAGSAIEPGIRAADAALESGAAEPLLRDIQDMLSSEVRRRFERAAAAKRGADRSVEAGRDYVEAYVEFIHYVEAIHRAASGAHSAHAAHELEGAAERASVTRSR